MQELAHDGCHLDMSIGEERAWVNRTDKRTMGEERE